MAEHSDPQYRETEHPQNPPQAVLNRSARRGALSAYLVPLIALCAVIGIALLYWAQRGPGRSHEPNELNPAVGTTGERLENRDDSPGKREEGGFDPASRPGNTDDEMKFRGELKK